MKKSTKLLAAIILLVFSFSISKAYAQDVRIDSLILLSTKSDNTDTLKIVCKSAFPNGDEDCGLDFSAMEVLGKGKLHITANHSPLWVSSPCESTDTITLGVLELGNYTLTYVLWDRVINQSDTRTIKFTVGGVSVINTLTTNHQFSIYPSPATSVVTLTQKVSNSTVHITDMLGRIVYTSIVTGLTMDINVADFPRGLYSVTIQPEGVSKPISQLLTLN